MDDQPLPPRLRELAEYLGREHREALRLAALPDAQAALMAAADELERLARRPFVDALEVLAALELHGEQHAPAGTERAARGGTHAGGLRAAAAIVSDLAGIDGDTPLAELGRAPQPRRFAARYPEGWRTPAPGSFVYAGPALAVWRVLAVDALAGHPNATHALELEAVDAHDVPMLARVETVPDPVSELDAEAVSA